MTTWKLSSGSKKPGETRGRKLAGIREIHGGTGVMGVKGRIIGQGYKLGRGHKGGGVGRKCIPGLWVTIIC